MSYVDGFVIPVPKRKLPAYFAMARKAAKVWMDHGAVGFFEALEDDAPWGNRTSFPRSVKMKKNETVVFSWIVYESRAHRDRVNKAVMQDKRLAKMMNPKSMPFDAKRMIYGGFKVRVQA
jgi:uncharacterized protein YbaA (DUF1428 family)